MRGGRRKVHTNNGRITHYFVAVKREKEEGEPLCLSDDDPGKQGNLALLERGNSHQTSTHPFFASNTLEITLKRARKEEGAYRNDSSNGEPRWGEVRAWRQAYNAPMFPPLCNTDLGPIWSMMRKNSASSMVYPIREPLRMTLPSIVLKPDALKSPMIEDCLPPIHIPEFREQQFAGAVQEIIAWIQESKESRERGEDEDDLFIGWKGSSHASATLKIPSRPILMITGPSGVGKSRMAKVLSERLSVPLVEVNGAVSIRNGRPFDDILAGSHKQRALMRKFASGQVSDTFTLERSPISSSSIKLIVLIDEVDLVFVQDKFYPALNSFLKAAPLAGILTIMTANADVRLMKRFIDFPSGTLFYHMSGGQRQSLPMTDDLTSLEEVIRRSDSSMVTLLVHQWIHHPDSPVYAIPWECQFSHCNWDEEVLYEHARVSSYRALWTEVLQLGWARGCTTFSSWCLEYLPGWRALERSARYQNDLRTRRTSRPVAFRPYLRDVPEMLVQRLLKL